MFNKPAYSYFGVVLIGIGFFASNVVTKMIVSTLVEKELDPWQFELLLATVFAGLMHFYPCPCTTRNLVGTFFI
jgi:hypothetical protein